VIGVARLFVLALEVYALSDFVEVMFKFVVGLIKEQRWTEFF